MTLKINPARPTEIEYPDSDGLPMADNTLQFQWIVTLKEGLEATFRNEPQVFVAGDLFWYPVQGNPKIRTAPDTMVAFGRPKGYRGSYKQWEEEGIPPQVVFEILSPGNHAGRPRFGNYQFYEQYGVEEFYLYDPERGGALEGWLRGTPRAAWTRNRRNERLHQPSIGHPIRTRRRTRHIHEDLRSGRQALFDLC